MKKLGSGFVNCFVRQRRKEKVARRATSGRGSTMGSALKTRAEMSLRSFRARWVMALRPDVARLATFLMPLRGQEVFKQLLRPTRVKRSFLVFLTTLSFVF